MSMMKIGHAILAFALAVMAPAGMALGADRERLATLIADLAPPLASDALSQIPDHGRKLLALRSYLRAGAGLAKRWSWTEERIRAFDGSTEQQALLSEMAAVNEHFSKANPGFEIYANTKVRSLEVQIENWNGNASVGDASAELLAAWDEKFGIEAQSPGKPDAKELRAWLLGFKSEKHAALAAPGLTLHGQAHAIDFQVMKNGELVARADTRQIETVWRANKWDMKLKESIDAAGPSFSGPLTSPDEPWHYNYEPATQVTANE